MVTEGHEMVINLHDTKPVKYKPYRISYSDRQIVRKVVSELWENSIACKSKSEYARPVLLVNDKIGERLRCIDHRVLNEVMSEDKYPMPRIVYLTGRLQGCKFSY